MNALSFMMRAVARPKAASKQAIMDAAIAVFRERGYEGTTIPAIAERAGIAQGTLYNYFPSKEKLLFACARAGGTPGTIFAHLRSDVGSRSVEELLTEAALRVVRFWDLRLPAVLMRAARPSAEDRPGVEFPRRALESVRDYFDAEIRAGRIRQADPETLAWGFLGGLFYRGFFDRVYGAPASFRHDRETFATSWAGEFAASIVVGAPARKPARRQAPHRAPKRRGR
jgi:AcrR family transcriptional regulator